MDHTKRSGLAMRLKAGVSRYLRQNTGIWIALFLLLIVMAVAAPAFFRAQNLSNMFRTLSTNMLLTLGMSFCLLIGGIDLSIGQSVAICGVITAMLMQAGVPWGAAAGAGVLLGALIGLVNGSVITYTGVPAFIATIAMQGIVKGAAFIIGQGSSIMVTDQGFYHFGNGYVLGIVPVPVLLLIAAAVFCYLVWNRTTFGSYMYAIGGNLNASRFSGIRTDHIQVVCYTLAGVMAGIAGVILVARMMGGHPNLGDGKELDAIASAVIGGVSFAGGRGTVGGAVMGAVVMGVLCNGMNVWGLNTYWQYVIKGLVILLAVLTDQFIIRRGGIFPRHTEHKGEA